MAQNSDKSRGKKPLPLKTKLLFGILFAVIAALFVYGVVLIVQENTLVPVEEWTEPPSATPPLTLTPTPVPSETPGPGGTAALEPAPTPKPTPLPPLPVYIYFPVHKIKTQILPVGVNADGAMDTVNDAHIAGWYSESASPGEEGNAIIAGHVVWKGKKGDFAILSKLKVDDEVVIEFREGYTRKFKVASNEEFPLDAIPEWVMKLDSGDSRVTLITCSGEFDTQLGTRNQRNVVVLKETIED